MISVDIKGDWGNTERFLKNIKRRKNYAKILVKYGELGVDALKRATPVDTGTTAESWRYEIQDEPNGARLSFCNDNVNEGVNIALILNYGHATGNGVWVEGRHYIEPAVTQIFDSLADELWKEVNG